MAAPARNAYADILPGDAAPWFRQRTASHSDFAFDTVGGLYVVLCFYLTAGDADGQAALQAVAAEHALFDDQRAAFFGVSIDPADEPRLRDVRGIRQFLDFDRKVSRLFGAAPKEEGPDGNRVEGRRFWLVLNPLLRVIAGFPFAGPAGGAADVFAYLRNLPPPERHVGYPVEAPILVVPQVFEPALCQTLIAAFDADGGETSGFMREVDGKTVRLTDGNFKRRRDFLIKDGPLLKDIQARIIRRLVPEIMRVHFFEVTRMERYLVACYSAEDRGHFHRHRDNTTKGTAHRRFAVSINLNGGFEGGDVGFPEYGQRTYRPPVGGAVIFSCSLLHEVAAVTAGKRYAFLPFLYDEAAAKIRQANNQHLGDNVEAYHGAAG